MTKIQSLIQLKNSFPPLPSKTPTPRADYVLNCIYREGEDGGGSLGWGTGTPLHPGCWECGRLPRTASWKEALLPPGHGPALGQL